MRAQAAHIADEILLELSCDRHKVDIVRLDGIPAVRGSILLKARAYRLVGQTLHPAVRMLDHEPLVRAEHLVGDQQRANHIVRYASARVADHVCIALRDPCKFCWVETAVHARDDGKTPRWIV